MTQFLPPNLLALFAPRDPIPYKPPAGPLTWEKDRTKSPYVGIGQCVSLFEDPKDTPPPTRGERKAEKKKRRIREKAEKRTMDIEEELTGWDPHNDPNASSDAFKTLFVSRINYDTSESKLRREFELYGKIKKISMVKNIATGKSRGYAFIEYEKERDMHAAYKSGDGKKIDGRRVLVDVERGRTVKGWKPRRLGGGLGSTRSTVEEGAERPARERDGPNSSSGRDHERERDRPRAPERSSTRDRGEKRERRGERGDRGERGERGDRERDGRRDRDREKRRRDDRGSDRDRGDRERRDRDKDRDRKRDTDYKSSRNRDDKSSGQDAAEDGKREDRRDKDRESRHRHSDRSKDKDRESRRERRRDRDDKDRDRSGRDREVKPEQYDGGPDAQYNSRMAEGAPVKMEDEVTSKQENYEAGGYYGGPGGDGVDEKQDYGSNGYYADQDKMEFQQQGDGDQQFDNSAYRSYENNVKEEY